MNPLPAPHGVFLVQHLPIGAMQKEKKKKKKSNTVVTVFFLQTCKVYLRDRVNAVMPQGPDEIKHHTLDVRQKHRPCLLHLTIWF